MACAQRHLATPAPIPAKRSLVRHGAAGAFDALPFLEKLERFWKGHR
jgi:hypothetical protein